MTEPEHREDWRAQLHRALVADSERRLAAGQRLYEGAWVEAGERLRLVRAARRRLWIRAVEVALIWIAVIMLGLALAGLAVLLA